MDKIRTHYDNLKVARDAPPEVIRAAFKSLSQKYHPDRNPGNPKADEITALLNAAFGVLSDPDKRRAHDLWIARQEVAATKPIPATGSTSLPRSSSIARPAARSFLLRVGGHWPLLLIVGSLLYGTVFYNPSTPTLAPKSYPASPPPHPRAEQPKHFRPALAPNGKPWPRHSAYLYPPHGVNLNALSSVSIDNEKNDADVHAKLHPIAGRIASTERNFYIPTGHGFMLKNVNPGTYDIRYKDLKAGRYYRTENFEIEEQALASERTSIQQVDNDALQSTEWQYGNP